MEKRQATALIPGIDLALKAGSFLALAGGIRLNFAMDLPLSFNALVKLGRTPPKQTAR
jgi:hypothetical protein